MAGVKYDETRELHKASLDMYADDDRRYASQAFSSSYDTQEAKRRLQMYCIHLRKAILTLRFDYPRYLR